MDVLRIATAGSVDDGKSSLIGRLLHDTQSITNDKLEAIAATSKRKGLDYTDLSLLTDGLIAEREQGITIDVAHIYFSTRTRKYIIADTPGHVEYTRNMVTGASNAEVSIILIDARNGIIEQTRRHLFIADLLKIDNVFVCVNKMDLVNFDESIFNEIRSEFFALATQIGYKGELHFIPVSALQGDNVVLRSQNMNWYSGSTLLDLLESVAVRQKENSLAVRLPVQIVIRPRDKDHHDFRGYAGRLKTGSLQKGREILVLPGQKKSFVKAIYRAEKAVDKAFAGDSIVVELEDDIDVSRGNMLVSIDGACQQTNSFDAVINWMDDQPLVAGSSFLLQHNTHLVKAKITALQNILEIDSMGRNPTVAEFGLNDIGSVGIKTARAIFADTYAVNPANGSFILIDEFTNHTVAVGFIEKISA